MTLLLFSNLSGWRIFFSSFWWSFVVWGLVAVARALSYPTCQFFRFFWKEVFFQALSLFPFSSFFLTSNFLSLNSLLFKLHSLPFPIGFSQTEFRGSFLSVCNNFWVLEINGFGYLLTFGLCNLFFAVSNFN